MGKKSSSSSSSPWTGMKKPSSSSSSGGKKNVKTWKTAAGYVAAGVGATVAVLLAISLYGVLVRRSRVPADMVALFDWARRNGAYVDNLEVRQLPNSAERGVFSTGTIKEGVVVAIPNGLCFTSTRVPSDPVVGERFAQIQSRFTYDMHTNRRATLALYLLYHKWNLGPRSFWDAYIRALPSIHSPQGSVAFLRPDEMELLDTGDNLHIQVKTHQDAMARMKQIVAESADLFPPGKISDAEVDWAYAMILTRAWVNDVEVTNVPIADLLNHDRRTPINTNVNETHRLFVMAPGYVIKPDVEVFDYYERTPAATSTAILWGFVPAIDDTFMKLVFPRAPGASKAQLELLAALSCPENVPMVFHCAHPPLLSNSELFKCIRPLLLSDEGATMVLHRIKRGAPATMVFEPVLTPEMEIQVVERLLGYFAEHQRRFRRTVSEDTELLRGSLSPPAHTALAVSISTKQCVNHAHNLLTDYLQKQHTLMRQKV